MGLSLRTTRYRYTRWAPYCRKETLPCTWDDSNPLELYDHSSDPGEDANVADETEYATVIEQLDKILRARQYSNTMKEWEEFSSSGHDFHKI